VQWEPTLALSWQHSMVLYCWQLQAGHKQYKTVAYPWQQRLGDRATNLRYITLSCSSLPRVIGAPMVY